jgi:hypothetical protein
MARLGADAGDPFIRPFSQAPVASAASRRLFGPNADGNLTLHIEGGWLGSLQGENSELHRPGRPLSDTHSLGDIIYLPQTYQLGRVSGSRRASCAVPAGCRHPRARR